jgi:isoquinoline 1-oxidoreductase beta subunit
MGAHEKMTGTSRQFSLNRRQFVLSTLAVGGGLVVGLRPVSEAQAATGNPTPWVQTQGVDFTAFISISPDNIVTVRNTSPDIGNGTATAAPMYVKEELHCSWDLIKCEFIPPSRDLAEGGAYTKPGVLAYFSGRSTGEARMVEVLQVAASTRERLKQAAATAWGVPVAEVVAEESMLTHPSGKSATFGQMAEAAAGVTLATEPTIKPKEEWTFVGKESPRKMQLPQILNGSAQYGVDVQVPGMVYAALRQVPVHGGRVKSANFDAIKNMPGVRQLVIIDPDAIRPGLPEGARAPFGMSASRNGPQAAVAVIADHFWQAQTALDVLPVEWDLREGVQWANTRQVYDALYDKVNNPVEPNIIRDVGDVTGPLAGGATIESLYHTPYMDHVNMEPLNGTALITDDKAELWMPSQHPQQALYLVADETGIPPANVEVYQTWVGTGFGRRVYGDDARMVAAVANQVRGTPVKVIWTREETMRQGRYRQIMAGKLSAKMGDNGYPEAVLISTAGDGPSARSLADSPYQFGVPNWRVQNQQFKTNLLVGPWRGPVYNSNNFMLETFINEMAETSGIDAIEFRKTLLANYEDKSWIALLDLVKEKSGWGADDGLSRGIAIGNWGMATAETGAPIPHTGTTVAAVVTIELGRRGQLSIPRIDVAIDTGNYINKDHLILMVEGGVIMSLSGALHEEINIENGRVVEGNLDTYRLMRQIDPALPYEIHVHLEAMSGGKRFSEAGEPPMGPIPGALAHAIFKAGGKWLRSHPFDRLEMV